MHKCVGESLYSAELMEVLENSNGYLVLGPLKNRSRA